MDSQQQTGDQIFRQLVLSNYYATITNGVNLLTWINTPKRDRRGKINKYATPFRSEFLSLFKLTMNLKSIEKFTAEAEPITKWFDITPDFNDDEKTIRYYKMGISLADKWTKILIDQSVIDFK